MRWDLVGRPVERPIERSEKHPSTSRRPLEACRQEVKADRIVHMPLVIVTVVDLPGCNECVVRPQGVVILAGATIAVATAPLGTTFAPLHFEQHNDVGAPFQELPNTVFRAGSVTTIVARPLVPSACRFQLAIVNVAPATDDEATAAPAAASMASPSWHCSSEPSSDSMALMPPRRRSTKWSVDSFWML